MLQCTLSRHSTKRRTFDYREGVHACTPSSPNAAIGLFGGAEGPPRWWSGGVASCAAAWAPDLVPLLRGVGPGVVAGVACEPVRSDRVPVDSARSRRLPRETFAGASAGRAAAAAVLRVLFRLRRELALLEASERGGRGAAPCIFNRQTDTGEVIVAWGV